MNDTSSPSSSSSRFVATFFIALGVLMLLWVAYSATTSNEWGTVQQGQSETYTVRIADNPFERSHGLSGSKPADLGDAIGMLFVFNSAKPRTFWMKDMKYNLDILWIRDGKVMKIDYNVPAPQNGSEPAKVSSEPLLVDMVLEMPAGGANRVGYLAGHELNIDLDAPEQN